MMDTPPPPAPDHDKGIQRLEAFSDGVYAIVITLLVFNIRVPTVEQASATSLISELLKRWPTYLAFAASFFFILVMWINHHRLFTAIRRSDNNLLLLNGLLLFGVTLVPLPTQVVAEFLQQPEEATAVMIYNGWFLVVALFFNFLWRYASHNNRLFTDRTDRQLVAHITRQYAFGPFLYFGALMLALLSPPLSLAANIALAVFFALPNRAVQQLIQSET